MDRYIRNAQLQILEASARFSGGFALSGGTALELYYLKHRFSRDLEFFSSRYTIRTINAMVEAFGRAIGRRVTLENELIAANRARVRFYTAAIPHASSPLKIDFVEDVLFEKPIIKNFSGVAVYDARNIYFQKITAVTGIRLSRDSLGREIIMGRNESRDVVDLYYLSRRVQPLHKYLKHISDEYQRGMVQWYRSFSRQEFKLGFLDLEIYDKNLDGRKVIAYIENEIENFVREKTK